MFYQRVRQYYRNQTPNGAGGNPSLLTPVLADWEAALRIYRYPESDWVSLIEEAQLLFFTVTEQVKPPKTEGPFDHPDLDEFLQETIESYGNKTREFVETWLTN